VYKFPEETGYAVTLPRVLACLTSRICPPPFGPAVLIMVYKTDPFKRKASISKKRDRPEEIIGKLQEAVVLFRQGKKVLDVITAACLPPFAGRVAGYPFPDTCRTQIRPTGRIHNNRDFDRKSKSLCILRWCRRGG
jgi:hypothetical protein